MQIDWVLAAMITLDTSMLQMRTNMCHRNDPHRHGYCLCGKPTRHCEHFAREWTPDVPNDPWMAKEIMREALRMIGAAEVISAAMVMRLRGIGRSWEEIGGVAEMSGEGARRKWGGGKAS